MFSKSELFSQVFLKDIGLRYRKSITQNGTFADQLFWNTSQSSRIRFTGISFLLRWLHFVSNVIFRDVYFPNYNCLLFFCSLLFTLCSLCDDLISSNIIVNVVWQNYFLSSMSVYVQPLTSKYGHTLEINTFILTSHRKICKLWIHT